MKLTKVWLLDAAERVGGVFAVAFVASLLATNVSDPKAALLAGAAAALEAVRSLLASIVPGTISPASFIRWARSK